MRGKVLSRIENGKELSKQNYINRRLRAVGGYMC